VLAIALSILCSYLLGSIPFGLLAAKLKGIDIREHGSGNIGSTNVLRVLGKGIGWTVCALDVLKGVLPVLLARIYAQDAEPVGLVPALTCIATILGHNYTFWLGFKGGKGIATSAGALLPIMPVTIVVAVILWIITFVTTRYVSLGSLVASVTLPTSFLIQGIVTGNWQWPLLGLGALAGGLAIYKHRANVQRLLNGTESKFERKKKPATP
jgi:acyl phosphate:glycerol-3-phosphate acyltransferase